MLDNPQDAEAQTSADEELNLDGITDEVIIEEPKDDEEKSEESEEESKDLKTINNLRKVTGEQGALMKALSTDLISRAKKGDDEALITMRENKQLNSYVKEKFPESYDEIFSSSDDETSEEEEKEVPSTEDIAKQAVAILRKEETDSNVKNLLVSRGAKGETYRTLKASADALIATGVNPESAVIGALSAHKRTTTLSFPKGDGDRKDHSSEMDFKAFNKKQVENGFLPVSKEAYANVSS